MWFQRQTPGCGQPSGTSRAPRTAGLPCVAALHNGALQLALKLGAGKGLLEDDHLSMTPCSTSSVHSSRSVLLAKHTPTLLAPFARRLTLRNWGCAFVGTVVGGKVTALAARLGPQARLLARRPSWALRLAQAGVAGREQLKERCAPCLVQLSLTCRCLPAHCKRNDGELR